MATSILIEDQLEIPAIVNLAEFRCWALSDDFPETGRIDYVAGHIEIDMSPEDLFTHATPKTEIVRVLATKIRRADAGEIFSDCTRISCLEANLSAEPDIIFISNETFESGRVQLIPKASGGLDRYVEMEGSADLIVEIISDSSVRKDTHRLPAAYWRAGVREYWLVDARTDDLLFRIHHRGESEYEPTPSDDEGFQFSRVLDCGYRLERTRNRHGRLQYTLLDQPR